LRGWTGCWRQAQSVNASTTVTFVMRPIRTRGATRAELLQLTHLKVHRRLKRRRSCSSLSTPQFGPLLGDQRRHRRGPSRPPTARSRASASPLPVRTGSARTPLASLQVSGRRSVLLWSAGYRQFLRRIMEPRRRPGRHPDRGAPRSRRWAAARLTCREGPDCFFRGIGRGFLLP
jgi:hypothetical protein